MFPGRGAPILPVIPTPENPMKPLVAIAGATSKQGRSVATTLLQRGQYRVRALTRNPAAPQAQALARLGAEVVAAPLAIGHDAAWRAAFRGADSAFLMTPPTLPNDSDEFPLGCALADAAVAAGVPHLIFSTLENVDAISAGRHYAPHFTDKARIADHIRGLPVAHSFILLAFFYTNLLEYYLPRRAGDTLLMPVYLPADCRAPFVDPLTATGPAVAEILARPDHYHGQTLPVIGDLLTPRELVATFSRITGIRAEYRSAYERDELLQYYPAFADNEALVQELLGMTHYAAEYGYYRPERDLGWSRRINPAALTWEQFLRASGWRGEAVQYGA